MKGILECVNELKNSGLRKTVDSRMKEFRKLRKGTPEEIFSELCFCILTANFSAERGIRIQKEIGGGFSELTREELEKALKVMGHRYPKARAEYIIEARKRKDYLKRILDSPMGDIGIRDWIVRNVKGLGYKEASHFLRNIGFDNLAIIDFHIIDILEAYNVIERPKTLTKRRYLEIERILRRIAKKLGVTPGELDLYLWYAETGKILK